MQKAIQDLKDNYNKALSLDNGTPGKHITQLYRKNCFDQKITTKTITQACKNFQCCKPKHQNAIIQHIHESAIFNDRKLSFSEDRTFLFKLLQLPPEVVEHIFSYVLTGNNNKKAMKKLNQLPLGVIYEKLAFAKEYNEKNNKLDMSEWFLLDTPKQYETVHNILSCKNNKYTIESSQELTVIRLLPSNIKNNLSFIHCTRDYEWHENMGHVVQRITNSLPVIKYLLIEITAELTAIGCLFSIDSVDFKKALLQGSFFGCSAGLGSSLSLLTYQSLRDIYGTAFWTIPISVSSGIVSYYSAFQHNNYLTNKIALFSGNFSLGALLTSSIVTMFDKYYEPYKPEILKVKKFLNQI